MLYHTLSDSHTVVAPPAPKPVSKGIDLEAEGTINGVGVYSYDVDELSEKPWLKPGNVDISSPFD